MTTIDTNTAVNTLVTLYGEDVRDACEIAVKWVEKLGLGLHPDTRGTDYTDVDGSPSFTADEAAEYERDLNTMLNSVSDIYELCAQAWDACGMLDDNHDF